jgi:hypothetical protein
MLFVEGTLGVLETFYFAIYSKLLFAEITELVWVEGEIRAFFSSSYGQVFYFGNL